MHPTSAPDQPSTDDTRERVTGTFKGYHVAAGFRGYDKICRGHPDNYWSAESLHDGRCGPLAMAANGPNAGWGYGCQSMLPFLREQREARSGEQLRGDSAQRRSRQDAGALADTKRPGSK